MYIIMCPDWIELLISCDSLIVKSVYCHRVCLTETPITNVLGFDESISYL